jgi:hypothetical protein
MIVMIVITVLSAGLFLLAFWRANIVAIAKTAMTTTRNALYNMRDPALDELARERAVQAAAVGLLVQAGSLILRSLLALAAAFIPILIADLAGIAPLATTLAFMERWDVILITTVIVTFGYMAGTRLWSR